LSPTPELSLAHATTVGSKEVRYLGLNKGVDARVGIGDDPTVENKMFGWLLSGDGGGKAYRWGGSASEEFEDVVRLPAMDF
jgi:hypothetical protein